jgi:hypothetical protein
MIELVFSLALASPLTLSAPPRPPALAFADDRDVDKRIESANGDVEKLLQFAKQYISAGRLDAAKRIYKKVVELDPTNEYAHKVLKHTPYAGKWFENMEDLAKYKRIEAEQQKADQLVKWKDQMVPERDVPFLNMGWTKDERGAFVNPVELARLKQLAEWRKAHFQFRADDNSWVAPEEMDKWRGLKWKCDGRWFDMPQAEEFHSKIGQWWQLDGPHFVSWTTCDWRGGEQARIHSEYAYNELVRIFGITPETKPHFIVLNSLEQYNQAVGGNPPLVPDAEGFSSLHGAYFADNYFDFEAKPPQYLGCGVSYWDRKDTKPWGFYWMRWAAAQSYVDAIDPSWAAIGERIAAKERGENMPNYAAAFWSEKKIPRWLRYGAASYVERFLKNPEAAANVDAWDIRKFAFAELKRAGGLHKLDDIFAFTLDLKKADDASRLYEEAGLLVAYMLDGAEGNKELAKKLDAFKAELKSGLRIEVAAAAEALQKELAKNEAAIKKFAGL